MGLVLVRVYAVGTGGCGKGVAGYDGGRGEGRGYLVAVTVYCAAYMGWGMVSRSLAPVDMVSSGC